MKRVVSFGDSFVEGLGTDRKVEESMLSENPQWEEWSDIEKNKARELAHNFRIENSFTKFFADKFNVKYCNRGESGCSNKNILDRIFEFNFEDDDFVLVGFTSSIRDKLPFWPTIFNDNVASGITWSTNEIALITSGRMKIVWNNDDTKQNYNDFFEKYLKTFITELYDDKYFQIYNLNLVSIITEYLKYKGVNYILFDAFEPMLTNKHFDKYWECGKKNIHSFLKEFNDNGLYEKDGYNPNKFIARHPSKSGHKLFAEDLYKFYKEVYDG